jgi:hypothetical protein
MQQIEICFHKIDLIVNIEKTFAISFHSHHNRHPSRPHIMFKRNEIGTELTFLGLFIMENLAWHVQINSLSARLSKVYYMIKSLRDVMSTHMLWSIYFPYFSSRLKYGIIFCF